MAGNVLRVAVDFFGCKLNQAEVESLCVDFVQAGCRLVPSGSNADIHVVNTCTVTHVADRKVRQYLRRIRRANPQSLLVATGCYAERSPREIKSVDNDILVVGNAEKLKLVSLLQQQGYLDSSTNMASICMQDINRTRSLVRIQEGCAGKCSYCVVPAVRPGSLCRNPDEILEEIHSRSQMGYREVVLTGTEIGSYKSAGLDLRGLITLLLEEVKIHRLRLSSLQPQHINEGFLSLWEDNRLCPHLHLPLQSGSQAVLERMRRTYSIRQYLKSLELIKESIKDVAITTDLIVGFPGETGNEFRETLDVCKRSGFARIHVFPYSSRPSTPAIEIGGQVDSAVIKNREAELIEFAVKATRDFLAGFQGRVVPVLWEAKHGDLWSGLTPNYIRVYLKTDSELYNCITNVMLTKQYRDGFLGAEQK